MVQELWTAQECEHIFHLYSIKGDDITEDLNNRSHAVTSLKAQRMGIDKPKPLTRDEQRLLKTYGSTLGEAMVFLLPGHSPLEVVQLCENLSS